MPSFEQCCHLSDCGFHLSFREGYILVYRTLVACFAVRFQVLVHIFPIEPRPGQLQDSVFMKVAVFLV